MWTKISHWYQETRAELLNVLLQAEAAEKITVPWRRKIALRLTKMSEIERLQAHQFFLHYSLLRLLSDIGKCALIFSGIGVLTYVFDVTKSVAAGVITSNLFGFAIVLSLPVVWFNYRRYVCQRQSLLRRLFITITLYVIAYVLITLLGEQLLPVSESRRMLLGGAVGGIGYMLFILTVSWLRNRSYVAIATQMQLEAEREKAARQLSEAQLRLLRAQIEPHFLFNTLGAVQQLAEQGAPKAAQLTANLIAFLRASSSEMRAEKITLRDEFALLDAYLAVMQTRLGARLRYTLDLPATLAAREVPSMALLTLAENAIKHGIEPAIHAGVIRISAHAAQEQLHIRVQDNGVGLSETPGSGIGLQNVRDRLRLTYGATARLEIVEHADGGVQALMVLPMLTIKKAEHLDQP